MARISREVGIPLCYLMQLPHEEIDCWIEIYKQESESSENKMTADGIKSMLRRKNG